MNGLTRVETVYGEKCWIKLVEYIGAKRTGRTLIPTYCKNGNKKYRRQRAQEGLILLHVDNIASIYE